MTAATAVNRNYFIALFIVVDILGAKIGKIRYNSKYYPPFFSNCSLDDPDGQQGEVVCLRGILLELRHAVHQRLDIG